MIALVERLADLGPGLALGLTGILALGLWVMTRQRNPLHEQRIGELTLIAALAFAGLAWLPLPRMSWEALPASDLVSLRAPAWLLPTDATPDQAARGRPSGSLSSGSALTEAQRAASPAAAHSGDSATGSPANNPSRVPEPSSFSDGRVAAGPRDVQATARGPVPRTAPARVGSDSVRQSPPAAMLGDFGIDVPLALAISWLIGAALAIVWLAAGVVQLTAILRNSRPAPEWLTQLADPVMGERPVRVAITDAAVGPFCVGVLRPTVVLPTALACAERRADVLPVLHHELAHARQGDGKGRLLLAIALPLLWWHPLFWSLRRRIRLDAELMADDRAARLTSRARYARRLIDLAAEGIGAGPAPAATLSIFGSQHDLTRRIHMLMHRTRPLTTRCSNRARTGQATFALALFLCATGLFGATPVSAQNAEQSLEISRLRTEREALQSELQSLRAELDALHSDLTSLRNEQIRTRASSPSPTRDNQIATTDARGSGRVSTTVESGGVARRDALESHRQVGTASAGQPAAVPDASPSPAEVKTWRALGYVGSAPRPDAPGNTQQDHSGVALTGASAPAVSSPARDPQTSEASGMALGSPSGLLELVGSYMDLRSQHDLEVLELERTRLLAEKNLVSDVELHSAQVRLEGIARRLPLLRQLLVAEAQALDLEIVAVARHADGDLDAQARLVRLEARRNLVTGSL